MPRLEDRPQMRSALRYNLQLPTEYRSDDQCGAGLISNISMSGVLIEHVSDPIETGAQLDLRVSAYPGSFDTELPVEVVRGTRDGFAARFVDLAPANELVLRRILPAV
ncbi:MAG: PilZ domain-containing protein [Deltaproteobacteria bacterium]|nr:PilZ domain-containing protein [Deltaproteobacteria bacterium]MBW2362319.1 PilZ domain-containing protein [Deltaproteobacteria bacterium]